MNKRERAKFLTDLINNVKKDLLKENSKYPNAWDGIELRERIKDVFSQVSWNYGNTHVTKKRIKEYKNYCLVEGLI